MDRLADGGARVVQIEKADAFLVPVSLHVATEHGSAGYVELREQRGGAVALVIMGPGAGSPFLSCTANTCMTYLNLRVILPVR